MEEKIQILIKALEHYADPEQHIHVDAYGKVLFENDEGADVAIKALEEYRASC